MTKKKIIYRRDKNRVHIKVRQQPLLNGNFTI